MMRGRRQRGKLLVDILHLWAGTFSLCPFSAAVEQFCILLRSVLKTSFCPKMSDTFRRPSPRKYKQLFWTCAASTHQRPSSNYPCYVCMKQIQDLIPKLGPLHSATDSSEHWFGEWTLPLKGKMFQHGSQSCRSTEDLINAVSNLAGVVRSGILRF